ncbi:MAG: type II toxin-antitoxin system VapC family toxin [Verrucomicrobiota bacterium]
MKTLVLDTNAYSNLFRGEQNVADALAEADRVFLPVTVLAELLAGFKMGSREKQNRDHLNLFLSKPTVTLLTTDENVAESYADLVKNMRALGRKIPTNDLWIAAHTFATGGQLLTFDSHFESVPGLRLWPK